MEIAAAAGGVPALVDVPHSPGSGIGFRGFLLRNDSGGGGRDGCLQHKEEVKDV